jgi:hypothetical protein
MADGDRHLDVNFAYLGPRTQQNTGKYSETLAISFFLFLVIINIDKLTVVPFISNLFASGENLFYDY